MNNHTKKDNACTFHMYFLYLCPTEKSGLLMSSLCKINALLEGSGCGGERNARGVRTVDFKQGT